MVAPEVLVASDTMTAPFCAAAVEMVGAAACEFVVPVVVEPPPLPQPATRITPAASAQRNRNAKGDEMDENISIAFIRLDRMVGRTS